MKKLKKVLSVCVGIAYTPLYLTGFVLNRVARVVLMVGYVLLLDGRKAIDIYKNLFTLKY